MSHVYAAEPYNGQGKQFGNLYDTKQVLLYSGGMDSYLSAFFHPNAKLVYMDVKSTYGDKELKYLHQYAPREVEICTRLNLSDNEIGESKIIRNRNTLMALMAVYYLPEGGEILVQGTAGDPSTDNDDIWALALTGFLSITNRAKWVRGPMPSIVVKTPSVHLTKAQMTKKYLEQGGDPVKLAQTISCYHPEIKHCGLCKPCIRKWFALRHNNIGWNEYDTNPVTRDLSYVVDSIKAGTWTCSNTEDQETLSVLASLGYKI